ncbi:O-antigen ligase family protein [Diaminobutyricibacter sp. McL0608]|uniref:O-antigen ligase family protein n=1 Tax=Leifsonia sp. McL0608 TaxID=3143537 RepID=UPI0031F2F503
MSTARRPVAVGAFSTLLVFTLFAGDFWRNLLSWWGWGLIAAGLVVGSIVLLVRIRPPLLWRKLPVTLGLFLLLATLSIAWSYYPGASALGVALQWCTTIVALFLALCLEWPELLRALSHAFRWILGLSLLFEFVVAAFIRHPVLPFWTDYGTEKVPQAFYWSRGLLFHGGQIQGIQGNSNLLAMVALLALVVFGVQLADGVVRRGWGIAWLVVAGATFVLTRSATIIIAAVFTAVVLLFALWMRRAHPDRRRPVYLTMLATVVVAVAAVWAFSGQLLKLFGKSEDLTGRLDIWHSVTALASQRPTFGWGWVSYWVPWVEPFTTLAVRKGVTYLQAHNAWLDVWLQLGVLGLVIFILLVATTVKRSWFLAVDRPRISVSDDLPYTSLTLLPLLLIAALVAQSAAESRMLVEAGWMLLVVISVKTKRAAP